MNVKKRQETLTYSEKQTVSSKQYTLTSFTRKNSIHSSLHCFLLQVTFLPGIFIGRDIIAFSILPKLMFLSFIIFNYSTPPKVSSLKLNESPSSCCDKLCCHTSSSLSMSICRGYCCLVWQISILQLHELNQKLSSCHVDHHMYELHVVRKKFAFLVPR